MKTIQVREWKDLTKKEKEKARERKTDYFIEAELEILGLELEKKVITEDEYYEKLGCSKVYAESTSWFIPACYYEKHKKEIDKFVLEELKGEVFDRFAEPIIV